MRGCWALTLASLVAQTASAHDGDPGGQALFFDGQGPIAGGGSTGFWFLDGEVTWACEDAFSGLPRDWAYVDGTVLAATEQGLRTSADRGCSWDRVAGLETAAIAALDGTGPIWAAVAEGPGGEQGGVWRSEGGADWSVAHATDVALSSVLDRGAIAAAGARGAEGVLLFSDDGVDWTEHAVSGWGELAVLERFDGAWWIAGTSANGVFGLLRWDGAATLSHELPLPAAHMAVAGGELWLASGPSLWRWDGAWQAVDAGPVDCLVGGAQLWACGTQPDRPVFARWDGAGWSDPVAFADADLQACPDETAGFFICPEIYSSIRVRYGLEAPGDDGAAPADCGGCPGGGAALFLLPVLGLRRR